MYNVYVTHTHKQVMKGQVMDNYKQQLDKQFESAMNDLKSSNDKFCNCAIAIAIISMVVMSLVVLV